MTASDLKYEVEQAGHSPHYFTRKTMQFFGDTMRNYGVRSKPVEIETYDGTTHLCWELYRRKPVKHGLQNSAYFCIKTFNCIRPRRDTEG